MSSRVFGCGRAKDGTTMDAQEIMEMASMLGKTWRRYRRRKLPNGVRDLFADLLLGLREHLVPTFSIPSSAELQRSRSDIAGVAELLANLACRRTANDKPHVEVSSTAKPTQSWNHGSQTGDGKVIVPEADRVQHVVAEMRLESSSAPCVHADVVATLHREYHEERFGILVNAARKMTTGILGSMRSNIRHWPPLETFGETEGMEAIKFLIIGSVLQNERFDFSVEQAARVRAELMELADR